MSKTTREFPVGDGHVIVIDTAWRDITSNLAQSGSDVAANMGKCSDVIFVRAQELAEAQAEFRGWKANQKLKLIAKDPKHFVDWRCKEHYRVKPEYMHFYRRIAELEAEINWLESMQNELQVKAPMVRTFINSDFGTELAGRATGVVPDAKTKKRKRGRVKPPRNLTD